MTGNMSGDRSRENHSDRDLSHEVPSSGDACNELLDSVLDDVVRDDLARTTPTPRETKQFLQRLRTELETQNSSPRSPAPNIVSAQARFTWRWVAAAVVPMLIGGTFWMLSKSSTAVMRYGMASSQ